MIPINESNLPGSPGFNKCRSETKEVFNKLSYSLDESNIKVKDAPNVEAFAVIFPNPIGEQQITGMSIVVPYCLENTEKNTKPIMIETYLITENSLIDNSGKAFWSEESASADDNINELILYINDCNTGNIDFSNFD
tara:strand:- start:125 stop:535 length:411 start_codon:yes stop_codon:yes gene_type:complete